MTAPARAIGLSVSQDRFWDLRFTRQADSPRSSTGDEVSLGGVPFHVFHQRFRWIALIAKVHQPNSGRW